MTKRIVLMLSLFFFYFRGFFSIEFVSAFSSAPSKKRFVSMEEGRKKSVYADVVNTYC